VLKSNNLLFYNQHKLTHDINQKKPDVNKVHSNAKIFYLTCQNMFIMTATTVLTGKTNDKNIKFLRNIWQKFNIFHLFEIRTVKISAGNLYFISILSLFNRKEYEKKNKIIKQQN